ncbi:hypothetical protein HBE96_23080 [Clostridium sp. P21]|uniref:Uncharacterized protein n=1 Tax=Clostridium muellerianum TaxID=2716538 RepID=A0A7Y0EL65_9CLOT|nr:hypothetical protein [Clostridium muellerianum]NMM65465.1 hypothetical protein [Clostridium muellerianum]
MGWKVVDIRNRRRRGEAFATIANNRVSLNTDACKLIDIEEYRYIQIVKNDDSKNLKSIGLKFIKESNETSFSFLIRKSKNDHVNGADINSRPLIVELFGQRGIPRTSKYSVSLDKNDKSIIVIDLNKEM